MKHSSRQRQSGQMIPFAAAFLVVCAALFYFAVNAGQLAIEKTRVVNAADAAAYSAGVVQARALNLTAYTNRAIVANQVAVAQSLTLINELNHLASFYSATDARAVGALADGTFWATLPNPANRDATERYLLQSVVTAGSLIGQFYGYSPDQFIDRVLPAANGAASLAITAADSASVALELQMRALWSTGILTLNDRAMDAGRTVARIMDKDIHVRYTPSALTDAAPSIVKRYADDERTRAQDVVLRSLDPQIHQRDEDVYSMHRRLLGLKTGFERRGATTMPDLDHWTAIDKQDYRKHEFRWWNPLRTATRPIEGATASIGRDTEASARFRHLVLFEKEAGNFFARYSGMASIHDIDNPADTSPTQARPGFSVYAFKKKTATRTSGHHAGVSPAGQLALYDTVPDETDEIASIARAEIVFHRPPRADGKTEYPNLFNPYWTVRLTQPKPEDDLTFLVRRYW